MMEDPRILQLTIRHYQELLKLDRHTKETRQHLIELLARSAVPQEAEKIQPLFK